MHVVVGLQMPASEPSALPLPFSRCLHSATKLLQPTGVSSLQTRGHLVSGTCPTPPPHVILTSLPY